MKFKSVVLCILDGWGNGIENSKYNPISSVNPPYWQYITTHYPRCNLSACGVDVGLPEGQIGNSEVGHMNIGSGRLMIQSLQRINQEIKEIGSNKSLINFIGSLKAKQGVCHILGLLSDGGVHSHQSHISMLANKVSQQGVKVMVHVFLDGRDTPPNSGKKCIIEFKESVRNSMVEIATISGRYYAMDRDNRWERTIKAYEAIAFANATCQHNSDISLIDDNYKNDITDEFIEPTVIGKYRGIRPEDGILLANFRADRMLQLTSALIGKIDSIKVARFFTILSMTQYKKDFRVPYLFSPVSISNTLGEIIANNKLKQLRIAETEKYAHVTFFFNCGREEPFIGEERVLIPSPKVKTYDLKPEMSAFKLTEKIIDKIYSQEFALIVANYANPDMIGHTGNMKAAQKAILVVDNCLIRILSAIRKLKNTALIITSDHGNIECMFNEEENISNTAHTLNTVPFILCFDFHQKVKLRDGKLSDIASTILELLKIKKPNEITGNSLLT